MHRLEIETDDCFAAARLTLRVTEAHCALHGVHGDEAAAWEVSPLCQGKAKSGPQGERLRPIPSERGVQQSAVDHIAGAGHRATSGW